MTTALALGDYTVVLTATDSFGATNTDTALVHIVTNLPPACTIRSPDAGDVVITGTSVDFVATSSACFTQSRSAVHARSRSLANSPADFPPARANSTACALYSAVNDLRTLLLLLDIPVFYSPSAVLGCLPNRINLTPRRRCPSSRPCGSCCTALC